MLQNLVKAVTTARTTPKHAGQQAGTFQHQKNEKKSKMFTNGEMTRTMEPSPTML